MGGRRRRVECARETPGVLFFSIAAAIVCCGSASTEDGTEAIGTPLCSFHGDADRTVPVSVSRNRVAARRTAGGRPLYAEYPGVDHNAWEWACTPNRNC